MASTGRRGGGGRAGWTPGITEALVYLSFSGLGTAYAPGYVPGLSPETFSVPQTIITG